MYIHLQNPELAYTQARRFFCRQTDKQSLKCLYYGILHNALYQVIFYGFIICYRRSYLLLHLIRKNESLVCKPTPPPCIHTRLEIFRALNSFCQIGWFQDPNIFLSRGVQGPKTFQSGEFYDYLLKCISICSYCFHHQIGEFQGPKSLQSGRRVLGT